MSQQRRRHIRQAPESLLHDRFQKDDAALFILFFGSRQRQNEERFLLASFH